MGSEFEAIATSLQDECTTCMEALDSAMGRLQRLLEHNTQGKLDIPGHVHRVSRAISELDKFRHAQAQSINQDGIYIHWPQLQEVLRVCFSAYMHLPQLQEVLQACFSVLYITKLCVHSFELTVQHRPVAGTSQMDEAISWAWDRKISSKL